jgi:aminoglycoside phosphotransferase (APT) family kinase protein
MTATDVPTLLARAIHRNMGDGHALANARRLSGGASRETWAFDVAGPESTLPLILRRDPPRAVPLPESSDGTRGIDRITEAVLQKAARAGGVRCADVTFTLDADDELGDGYVMERIEGETIARKILRDADYAAARPILARQCGEALARIHALSGPDLPVLPVRDARTQWSEFRDLLDGFGDPHPTFELAFRWLDRHMPAPAAPRTVHGDFRMGNIIVGPDGLRAVLDWELAHIGDPMADLGWVCINAWRFGVLENQVGGFGSLDDLIAGYEAAGGMTVDRERVRFWEVFGTLKWGISCKIMAWTHLSGTTRSVELATIGRRACENELDLLDLLL